MSNGVSVERSAVGNAIKICNQAIQGFQKASGDLQKKYQTAGSNWKDSKYAQLGGIVSDCNQALTKPISQLEECIRSLQELDKAIAAYESTSVK